MIFSLELEKQLLAGLIKHPHKYSEISTLTTKANKILADPDVQAQISSDVAAGSAQIEKDISSALDKIPADLSAVIPEGGIKVPNFGNKFPKKFPI